MTRAILTALLSHWRRKPFQLFTLIIGLALATALWSGVQAINAEARKSYADAADLLGGSGLAALVSSDGKPISNETYIKLRRSGWQVSPVIDGWISADQGRVRLLGIDPFTAPPGTTMGNVITPASIGGMLGSEGRFLASSETAKRLTAYADRIEINDTIAPGLALADISAAGDLLDQPGYSRLVLAAEQPLIQAPLETLAPDLRVQKPETADDLGRLTDSFHLNLTAFGLLSFAVGLFIVNGAVGLAFEQRRPVFRTLRALGATARQLVLLLALELLVLALVAGVVGIVIGYVIAAALLPDVAATLRGLYGATVEGTLTLSPLWWLSGIGIACAGTALAAASGLLRVARMPPLAPARPRAWAMANDTTTLWQLAMAGACLATALAAFALGGGLLGGFIILGGFLLATALTLPAILALGLTIAARFAKHPLAVWFWADTRQQLPGLSLALMALMLALSANIGVGTMVSSFRLTFEGWLDQRLVSDLYVTIDPSDAPKLERFLETRADALLPIWHTEAEVLGAPAEIYGVVDHPIYAENWPLLSYLPDTWEILASGKGALVNEQLARREGLTPGNTLAMPGGWETEIVGVYSDYGNPLGQIVIPLAALNIHYPDADRSDFGVLTDRPDDLRAALVSEFGLAEDDLVDQRALKAFSMQIFERTFAVTGALNILTLSVAGIAILTSLLTLASMRLPQLAPVWALGLTRATLARVEILRALILAGLTFLLSLPVGLGLAWVLLSIINVEAFGWRLPMSVFPADWLWLGLLSLAAAGLASLWPARQLAKRPPADLIRVFAHER